MDFYFYKVFNLILQSAQNNHIQEIEQSVIEAQNVIDKNKK